MKRRTFVKSAVALGSVVGISQLISTEAEAQTGAGQRAQYFELRQYTIDSERQQKLIDEYWRAAAIPAYNRAGVRPIGVFTPLEGAEVTKMYVLIPYDSLELVASVPARVGADSEYLQAGADYLNAPKSEPAYNRIESSLSVAFDGMKRLEAPPSAAEKKPWIFELRTYESHSEVKGANKVLMFNSGEIPLMREVGLTPVFFAQTLIGGRLPNLVYMVSGEDKAAHQKHWQGFFAAPVWKQLSGDPKYKDNVSKVVSVFLKRTDYSQI